MGNMGRGGGNVGLVSAEYRASGLWAAKTVSVAADRYKILSPEKLVLDVDGQTLRLTSQQTLDLSASATWDTTSPTNYTTAANRAGKDFYVYACQPTLGTSPAILVSANSTVPSGYTADTSRKVGGFHCLCVAVNHTSTLTAWAADTVIALGETRKATVWDGYIYRCTARAGDYKTHATTQPTWSSYAVGDSITDDMVTWIKVHHTLEGYAVGDVLPATVWGLDHRPICDPSGMFYVPSCDVWLDIYEQSGTGSSTASVYGGTISHSRTLIDHNQDMVAVGKRLPFVHEHEAGAAGSNWGTVIQGGADPTTTGGHLDAYGRRMTSNLGGEDMCGAHNEMMSSALGSTSLVWGGAYNQGDTTREGPYGFGGSTTILTSALASESARGACPSRHTVY